MKLEKHPINDLYLNRAELERLLELMNTFGNSWVHIINETNNLGAEEGPVVEFFTELNSIGGLFTTTLKNTDEQSW